MNRLPTKCTSSILIALAIKKSMHQLSNNQTIGSALNGGFFELRFDAWHFIYMIFDNYKYHYYSFLSNILSDRLVCLVKGLVHTWCQGILVLCQNSPQSFLASAIWVGIGWYWRICRALGWYRCTKTLSRIANWSVVCNCAFRKVDTYGYVGSPNAGIPMTYFCKFLLCINKLNVINIKAIIWRNTFVNIFLAKTIQTKGLCVMLRRHDEWFGEHFYISLDVSKRPPGVNVWTLLRIFWVA